MQTELAVSVIAAFNTSGECVPRYIRLETKEHELKQYKIINSEIEQKIYAGITYLCSYQDGQKERIIKLRYSRDLMKWFLLQVIK